MVGAPLPPGRGRTSELITPCVSHDGMRVAHGFFLNPLLVGLVLAMDLPGGGLVGVGFLLPELVAAWTPGGLSRRARRVEAGRPRPLS